MVQDKSQNSDRNILISIIIPHFNGEKIIVDCLESLQKSSFQEKEIIVVDNGSTDKSVSLIELNYSNVKIIKSQTNRGYAGGCNLGAENAVGKYLIFLNNDTFQKCNWIEPLVEMMERDESISSIQPKILNAKQKDYFDYAGGSGGFLDKYGFPFARGRIFDTVEKDNGQYDDACEIFWASGTAFITQKIIFQKIGGFDETLFAHFEEIDYHWKCKLAGFKVWVQPDSVVYHIGGATLSYQSPQKTYLNHRNSFVLMLTNTSRIELIKYIIPRIAFEKISFFKDFFTGKFAHAFAQFRAGLWIILNTKFVLKKRKFVQSINPAFNSTNFYSKSIVIKYFLFFKQKFKDL